MSHLEFTWNSPIWKPLIAEFTKDHFVVRHDQRANGLSDWDVEDISFEAWVRDLETVVAAANLDRFALFGSSQGCAVAMAYAARNPDRVTHLVLQGGFARGWRKDSPDELVQQQEAMITLIRQGWGQATPAFRDMFAPLFFPGADADQVESFNTLTRISTSPENAARIYNVFGDIDVVDLLPQITTPTLVFHSRDDATVPLEGGREIASLIPNARFILLEGSNHIILKQDPDWPRFLEEIRKFLRT
jgi:pimeloyl-ACP methyl ester carboxylesterase